MAWRHHYFDDTENDDENSVETNTKEKFPFPDKKNKTNLPKEFLKKLRILSNQLNQNLLNKYY
jgi:hypothetical protein